MTERPDMITGVVTYWNGRSGWIKQDAVNNKTTAESYDVCLRVEDIASGTVENGTAVTFWFDKDYGIARDVKVITAEPPPVEPPPIEPEPELPPNSPA